MSYDCSQLKAGDRVWVGKLYSDGSGRQIKTIAKVTTTQIVIDWNGNGGYCPRYRKGGGYAIGGGRFADNITGLATSDECAAWDAKQERERKAAQVKADAEAAIESKRSRLYQEFRSDRVSVTTESWGQVRVEEWTVEFHYLTEDQVRAVARIYREAFNK